MKQATIALLSVALVGSAFAEKQQYLSPVYDHVGKVVESITVVKHDSEAHIDTEYGSANAYCDISGTSITCSDSAGPHYLGVLLPTSPSTGNEDLDALTPSLILEDELTSIEGKDYRRGAIEGLLDIHQQPQRV